MNDHDQPQSGTAPADWPVLPDPTMLPRLIDVIVREGKVDPAAIRPDATLESLDILSIDVVTILMALEEEFDCYIPMSADLSDVRNLHDLIEVIVREMQDDPLKDIGRKPAQ